MFGTYERFNLVRAAYARRASRIYIFEDFYKPGLLHLSGNRSGDMMSATDFMFDIILTVNGTPVSYTYFADEGSLTLRSGCASAEIALTDRGHLRIRGDGAGLRLELKSNTGGGARACRGLFAPPCGGGWEADFGKHGRLFFRALTGAFSARAPYDEERGVYSSATFDFLPDSAGGKLDAAIHDYANKITPFGQFEPFEEVVIHNKADFAEFSKIYRPVAPEYEEAAKYARWTIWSHRTAADGSIKEPSILYQVAWVVTAASWQQSYNAMPMLENPTEAWRQICLMFKYQDERTGRLPGMLSYNGPNNAGMQPPFQGFALDFIIRNIGDGFLTPAECERMYPKFAKWANYWTTYRNAGHGADVTAVLSPHESGWDDSSVFAEGFPASEPNTMAFLVLLMESVARLARGCGRTQDADDWDARAKRLTKTLIDEYWDGEKFVTKVKGKAVDSLSLACYQPIMLGKRLPQEIIDKIAEKLTREGEWLTEIGLASESMKSERTTFGISFVCGRVVAPQNMILTVGLQAAGKQREAALIARRFCDQVSREGVILGFAPYDYYPLTGAKADQQIPPQPADAWPWSSWCSNCFLTMAGNIVN
ncbi:MAG: hypothetical protein LBC28_02240 [Oscillospiraceae bacterium]|nr:hypothetical protein [Oscillospiraceae bacterium]